MAPLGAKRPARLTLTLSGIQGCFITFITLTRSPPGISLVDLSNLLTPILSGYLILHLGLSLTPWPG